MAEPHERLHAIARGIVQGVNFRSATRDRARRLRLTGWVRNLPDGTVEVLAEGPRDRLAELLQFLQAGPPAASVSQVETRWSAAAQEFESFDIRW